MIRAYQALIGRSLELWNVEKGTEQIGDWFETEIGGRGGEEAERTGIGKAREAEGGTGSFLGVVGDKRL